jgi:hypothetical protein
VSQKECLCADVLALARRYCVEKTPQNKERLSDAIAHFQEAERDRKIALGNLRMYNAHR